MSEEIKIGKYTFKVTESKLVFGDRIINHSFKIGGEYDNCISVSYIYQNNIPVAAKIPHALYEPECSLTDTPLEKGHGTILMLKGLLKHVYKKIPVINTFEFDDMSHIDCIEKDMKKTIPRKPSKPLNLAYFSIAYNSETWYEKYFNATMINKEKYNRYKASLDFLTDENKKESFIRFLEISRPQSNQIEYLESFYNKTKTYREFFNAIPKDKRCDMLYGWITTFMEYYLKEFDTNKWEIDIRNIMSGGSRKPKRKSKNITLKNRIILYRDMHNF